MKAALAFLCESNVRALSYDALLRRAREQSRLYLGTLSPDRDQADEVTLKSSLMNLYAKGALEIYSEQIAINLTTPERPAVDALVRYGAATEARVLINRLHQAISFDPFTRMIVTLCDGTHTRDDICAILIERQKEGKLQVRENGQLVMDLEKLRVPLASRVDSILHELAYSGFFAP